jgi:hypothetical protein
MASAASDVIPDAARTVPRARPKSAVSHGVGFAGLAGLFAFFFAARQFGWAGPWAAMACVVACGIPMVLWSVLVDRVHRNPSTGIDWDAPARPFAESFDISLSKLAGLWATWAILGCIYALCRFYWQGNYLFAMRVFVLAALPLFVLSIPYVLWIDTRLKHPRDGAWAFGQWLMGDRTVDRSAIADHARSWAVKGFYTAFMVSIVPGNFITVVLRPWDQIVAGPVALAGFLISFMFLIDVAMATVGYVLTMKPLDAHIRSATPYLSGWVSALICYPPFIMMGNGRNGTAGLRATRACSGSGVPHSFSSPASMPGQRWRSASAFRTLRTAASSRTDPMRSSVTRPIGRKTRSGGFRRCHSSQRREAGPTLFATP